MTPLRLTSWFRRRMLALVLLSSVFAWLSVTAGFHLMERRELIRQCRADAAHAAGILAETMQQRPRLWRYDSAKFVDRISAGWQRPPASLVVHDASGVPVELGKVSRPLGEQALWGRAEVRSRSAVAARVWVAADTGPLWRRTLLLALVAALAEGVLGALLLLLPVRAIRTAEQRIAGLMNQLALTLREEERGRIARDLHDGAGQALTAARLHLRSVQRGAPGAELSGKLEPVVTLVDDALEEVRRSTAALMPPALAELGLRGAVQRHCDAFAAASGLHIEFAAPPSLPPCDTHVQISCYRIIQEALTNIARHARATTAKVVIASRGAELLVTVSDDGAGLEGAEAAGGSGLRSIQTRAELLGGQAVLTRAERGTQLQLTLPCGGQGS
jgi:signal transduction histidine kinase